MEVNDLFYKWVPAPVKLLVLFILLFALLVCNGVYLGNITDMYSSLAVYAEPFTMATNALYIGMGIGLIIGLRLKLRFTSKTLIIFGFVNVLLMNAVCGFVNDPWIMIAAVFWLGVSKMTALIEVFIIWMVIWARKPDTTKVYPFIYSTALGGIYFTTWITAKISFLYSWRFTYIFILLLILCCLVLCVLLMERHPLKRKVPLYQFDLTGLILLAASLLLLNYICAYGKVEDWFNSAQIKAAALMLVVFSVLFIWRESTVKRPMVNLKMFSRPLLQTGLFYFFLMGIFAPATFQSAFAVGVLKYENHRNVELNLYMIPGVLAGAVICYVWYLKQMSRHLLMATGFALFTLYHFIMYQSFGLDFTIDDFWIPSIIKGMAMVIIYIAVGLYATAGMPLTQVMAGAGLVIIVRSFVGTAIFSGIYNYYLYAQRLRHFEYVGGWTDRNDTGRSIPFTTELYVRMQQQATLAAAKELTGYIIIAGVFIVIMIVIFFIAQMIRREKMIQAQPSQA
ncbi:MAG: hypothetical protein DI535_18255 [Citrobacter freundii]|nr:MAG: hypothetical protein DI535_18255 [Citrobacter freundii]